MPNSTEPYLNFFKTRYQLDISIYDAAFLQNIITDRRRELAIEPNGEYLNYLESCSDEAFVFRDRLTNSYSEFFRNPLTFAYIEQVILPQIIEKKRIKKETEIRIWSAACALGQEAYSLAIICHEVIENKLEDLNFRIFATDINQETIDQAQRGIYQAVAITKATLNRIQTYFIRKGENYSIALTIKNYVDFSVFNLLSDQGSCPPASIYGNFDLVFCCNLLFYYKPEYRIAMLEKIGTSLAKGGYLITGETEREILQANNYREIFANSAIFQKRQ